MVSDCYSGARMRATKDLDTTAVDAPCTPTIESVLAFVCVTVTAPRSEKLIPEFHCTGMVEKGKIGFDREPICHLSSAAAIQHIDVD